MNGLDEIRSRRAELLARAAVERERVSVQIDRWRSPFALADRAVALARAVRGHPEWAIAAAALFVVVRPRRALAWARRGIMAWRAWRWIEQTLRAAAGARQA